LNLDREGIYRNCPKPYDGLNLKGIISLIEFPIYRKCKRFSDTSGGIPLHSRGNVRGRFFHKMVGKSGNSQKPTMPSQTMGKFNQGYNSQFKISDKIIDPIALLTEISLP